MSRNVSAIVAVAACLCEGVLFAEWARPDLVAKVAAGKLSVEKSVPPGVTVVE